MYGEVQNFPSCFGRVESPVKDFVHIVEVANCLTAPKHAESERHVIAGFMSADSEEQSKGQLE